jgi:hypothetical protein
MRGAERRTRCSSARAAMARSIEDFPRGLSREREAEGGGGETWWSGVGAFGRMKSVLLEAARRMVHGGSPRLFLPRPVNRRDVFLGNHHFGFPLPTAPNQIANSAPAGPIFNSLWGFQHDTLGLSLSTLAFLFFHREVLFPTQLRHPLPPSPIVPPCSQLSDRGHGSAGAASSGERPRLDRGDGSPRPSHLARLSRRNSQALPPSEPATTPSKPTSSGISSTPHWHGNRSTRDRWGTTWGYSGTDTSPHRKGS